jgi:hypothetical protein
VIRPALLAFVSALLLASATAASAQEVQHPLEAALTRQLRTAQFRAAGRCIETRAALFHGQGAAFVDTDRDGRGEFATLPELLGLEKWRGRDEEPAGVMNWPGAHVVAPGVVEVDGYLYRIELPDAGGRPTLSLPSVDADRAEGTHALVVAWPARYGVTGCYSYTLPVGSPDGTLMLDDPAYSGVAAAPPLGAALRPGDDAKAGDLEGLLAEPLQRTGKGRDGKTWRPRTDPAVNPLGSTFSLLVDAEALWRDGRRMQELLIDAFHRVEKATGAESGPPPRLLFVDHRGMHAALVEEQQPLFERFGVWEQAQQAIPLVAIAVPAKYVPADHALLFAPRSLELAAFLAELPTESIEAAVRAILLHEAVHAVDFTKYGLADSFDACANEGDLLCWSAMTEGHAQQVARHLSAGDDELLRGLADMERLLHDDEAHRSAPEALRAALVTLAFPYVEGEQFLDAVLAAGGQEAVDAVMRTPPTRPAEIEHPEFWFARSTREGPDILDVLALLRPLEPEGAKVHETPLLRASVASMLEMGVGDRAAEVAAGLEDGQTRSAANDTGTSQTVTTVLRCRDAAAAAAYVRASRAFQEAQDDQYTGKSAFRMESSYEDVPGGYRTRRSMRTAGGTLGGAVLCVAEGRFVLEVTLSRQSAANQALTRRLDDIVGAALRSLRPPADED